MTFEPQNELERSLVRASSDPAHRPQFYRLLAESDLFVIQEGVPPPATHQRITLPESMTIQLRKIEFRGRSASCGSAGQPGACSERLAPTLKPIHVRRKPSADG